jgi:hypothetical protein
MKTQTRVFLSWPDYRAGMCFQALIMFQWQFCSNHASNRTKQDVLHNGSLQEQRIIPARKRGSKLRGPYVSIRPPSCDYRGCLGQPMAIQRHDPYHLEEVVHVAGEAAPPSDGSLQLRQIKGQNR